MKHRIDPEGKRLPIKLGSTCNGEFAPVPLSPANLAANRLAHEFASSFSKKTNLTRRTFLVSSQAFRAFQIAPALRERHGYGEITPELRARIFGRNAAKVYGFSAADIKQYSASDHIARNRSAYLENPEPHFRTYGPKTRREFLALLAASPSP